MNATTERQIVVLGAGFGALSTVRLLRQHEGIALLGQAVRKNIRNRRGLPDTFVIKQ